MAEIVLSPLLEVVLEKLANPLLKEIAKRSGLKKEVKKVRRSLRVIQAVLEEAEERQLTDRALRIWLEELKEVAFEMEDLLDDFSPEVLLSRTREGFTQQVLAFVPSVVQYGDMLTKLEQIKGTLEMLAEETFNFNLRGGAVNTSGSTSRSRSRSRRTGSFIIESEIFGREEDKERVIGVLLSTDDKARGEVSVISIVGLGGLGKTTLAQLVFNDERVTKHFDMKIWACVNDDFDVEKIMASVIESATKNKCDLFGMDVLQFRLYELLSGKRYLLVLDDLWNEDDQEWDKLRTLLVNGGEGSTIIVTTRSEKVASQRAFSRLEEDHTNLYPIGKQIAKKCGGVPLAAKSLGSLMRFKRDEREWLLVQESDLWNVSESENGILPALRLSYCHMPSHLKRCFAYCSIFPKNYIIKKDKLIQLWIAEGLLQSPKGIKSLEFIGNEYFDDLVWMFFFQDIYGSDNGNITECKMHDIVHDLARSVAGDEYIMLEHGNIEQDLSHIRHSSIICNFSLSTIPDNLYEAKKLRTLILVFPKGDLGEVPPAAFSSFRYLRVLGLSGSGIKRLHESISSFIFLRYLDISNTEVKELPDSVCSLCRLQVMDLSNCFDLIKLPNQMSIISKLRHLILDGCSRLTKMPPSIGKLVFLRTLSMFIVGNEVDEGLNQLQSLNLGGQLNISHLEKVRVARDAMEADLIGKRNLLSLSLSWGDGDNGSNRNIDNSDTHEEVLKYLQPHGYLKRLSIRGYQGKCFPRWIDAIKLPNITDLVLINCRRCEYLPTLGKLPFLKVLYLQGMNAVKNIGPEFYGQGTERAFPLLKELTFMDFPHLEYWWSSNRREEFPSLLKLNITKCFKLRNIPPFPYLQHLELHHCNNVILWSASKLTSVTNLVINGFTEELALLENLLQNNALLMSVTISSCPKLHALPPSLGKLINLKSLTIRWSKELTSLPELQNLTSLDSLEIIECDSLATLPEDIQTLSSLRTLSIENCNSLTSLPHNLQFLTSLEHLTIMYCPKLTSLPEDLQHLFSLKSLSILNCPGVASLPGGLKYVTTLQNLEIRGCSGLKGFPDCVANLNSLRSLTLTDCDNLTSLPGGLQYASSLQHLSIRECPILEERCKKDTGEDWLKINHISHVYIGSPNFASSSSH
ncbi:putative disease resistance protein RGA4 [Mangifera indica]|uniref:putative disease resistance protein RGA4 n=1 Tax=Mangifera indica TaxID=29780 RepID=UPI001CFB5F0B|nr:putative disease resistance protein RGA4 [Mangifera indica]